MAIRIIDDEPEVVVTREELLRYRAEWEKAYQFYAGPPVSLEEYIRRQRANSAGKKFRP